MILMNKIPSKAHERLEPPLCSAFYRLNNHTQGTEPCIEGHKIRGTLLMSHVILIPTLQASHMKGPTRRTCQ